MTCDFGQKMKNWPNEMKSYELFKELSKQSYWSKKSRKIRFLAARYYTGVDSLEQLRQAMAYGSRGLLSYAELVEVEEIVKLR